MKRYGMSYARIRFYQREAINLHRTNGVHVGRYSLIHMVDRLNAQALAYAAIGYAAVATPEQLRRILSEDRSW
jgi:hypothetical protein